MSSSSSLARLQSSRQHTDSFRPNLPSDPFSDVANPWTIRRSDLKDTLDLEKSTRSVILILGDLSNDDIEPLLRSSSLNESLLLIVTSSPLQLPMIPSPSSLPSVCVLRLLSPMTQGHSGAQNLVSIYQRAGAVSFKWRNHSASFSKYSQLCECQPGGAFTIPEAFGFSPRQINLITHAPPPRSSTPISSFRPWSKRELPDPLARPFDAIINFIPSSLTDKPLLKYVILVTTLSQTFLTSTCSPVHQSLPASEPSSRPTSPFREGSFSKRFSLQSSHNGHQPMIKSKSSLRSSRRWSLVSSHISPENDLAQGTKSRPTSLLSSAEPSSSYQRRKSSSHIIHVLPSSMVDYDRVPIHSSPAYFSGNQNAKSVQKIEQFLLSYSHHPTASFASHSRGSSASSLRRSATPASSSTHASGESNDSASIAYSDIVTALGNNLQRQHRDQRPNAYIVSRNILGYKPRPLSDVSASVVELLLLGLLDPQKPTVSALSTFQDFVASSATVNPRAWIRRVEDVRIVDGVDNHSTDDDTTILLSQEARDWRASLRVIDPSRVQAESSPLPSPPASSSSSSYESSARANATSFISGRSEEVEDAEGEAIPSSDSEMASYHSPSEKTVTHSTIGAVGNKFKTISKRMSSSNWRFWKTLSVHN